MAQSVSLGEGVSFGSALTASTDGSANGMGWKPVSKVLRQEKQNILLLEKR